MPKGSPGPVLTVVLGALIAVSACRGDGALVVQDPWILAPPRGSDTAAAYGVIRNGTDARVNIIGASSRAFGDVSIHRTVVRDGQAVMRPVDTLVVPPGGRAEMSPGGLHLMLSGAGAPLEKGQERRIVFRLDDGTMLDAGFEVRDSMPGG